MTSERTAPVVGDEAPDGAAPGIGGNDGLGVDRSSVRRGRGLLRWEGALVLVLLASIIFGSRKLESFLSGTNLFYIGLNVGEIAIMALPLTLIVITGEIDLSVASMLGLSGATMGVLFSHGWSIWLCIVAALVVGLLGGALNGLLITVLGLPSIAVTIGTLTLFRGIDEIILAPQTVTGFPIALTNIGAIPVGSTHLSFSTVIFLILAVIAGVVLHATPLGRFLFAIGLQPEAAQFSGVRVRRIKFGLYVLSGFLCAFAGILFTLKNSSVSYDAGTGLELTVVAVVLFGGVSIFGGRGSIIGVVLSVAIIGVLQQILTQLNIQAEIQNIITGVLLLISVVVPNLPETTRRLQAFLRRRRA